MASKTDWQLLRGRLEQLGAEKNDKSKKERQSSLGKSPSVEEKEEKEGEHMVEGEHDGKSKGLQHDGEMSKDELKDALIKVLNEVENLSSRHDTLLSTQLDLENALKIARSNLTMAEANSEMLEEALRRGGDGFAGRMAPLPARGGTPTGERRSGEGGSPKVGTTKVGTTTITSPISIPKTPTTQNHERPLHTRRRSGSETAISPAPIPIRPGVERSNTVSANTVTSSAAAAAATSAPGSSLGSFFRRSMEKRPAGLNLSTIAKDISNSLPSPTAETRNQWLSQLGMTLEGGSTPNLSSSPTKSPPARVNPLRDAKPSTSSTTSTTTTAQQYELYRLRQTLSTTQTQLSNLQLELSSAHKAKTNLEEELESLSQELFEEANKMVADERKKCVELEAEVKDVRLEMEAMKRTMKVLEDDRMQRMAVEGMAGQQDVPDGFPEEQMGGKISREVEGDVKDSNASLKPVTPPETDLDELMQRMEADFGKL